MKFMQNCRTLPYCLSLLLFFGLSQSFAQQGSPTPKTRPVQTEEGTGISSETELLPETTIPDLTNTPKTRPAPPEEATGISTETEPLPASTVPKIANPPKTRPAPPEEATGISTETEPLPASTVPEIANPPKTRPAPPEEATGISTETEPLPASTVPEIANPPKTRPAPPEEATGISSETEPLPASTVPEIANPPKTRSAPPEEATGISTETEPLPASTVPEIANPPKTRPAPPEEATGISSETEPLPASTVPEIANPPKTRPAPPEEATGISSETEPLPASAIPELANPPKTRPAPPEEATGISSETELLPETIIPDLTNTPKTRPAPPEEATDISSKPELLLESTIPELANPPLPSTLLPYAPPTEEPINLTPQISEGTLHLTALLREDGESINQGLIWRVYSTNPNQSERIELIDKVEGGTAAIKLKPGQYLVHATYGYATKMRQVVIAKHEQSETFNLEAGGVKLDAVVNETTPLAGDNLLFDIYSTEFDEKGERKLIVANVKKNQIVRLKADTYHVVSRFGDVNAVVRADIQIQPGKLVEATIHHSAATITLKLVKELGGEALVGTAWVVLTPSGDTVAEGFGAFPTYVLTEGEYEVVAKYREVNYVQKFNVKSGIDQEVEVLTQN